ncbi:hypothetical protein INT80_15330 [Gallibacterium anatis]|uniref:Uncharacterized protein n=1 Tax=Gallibacterium anatis TaxID=750 RepID=A0A930USH3_9PAST|nr:hypothetical protein [Gallibacterium anatis]
MPEIHICCYHSRQLLLLRNRLEQSLDKLLLNRYDRQAIFNQPEIKLLQKIATLKIIFLLLLEAP